jgi:hypothetical protein
VEETVLCKLGIGDELSPFSKVDTADELEAGEMGTIPELIIVSQTFNKSS